MANLLRSTPLVSVPGRSPQRPITDQRSAHPRKCQLGRSLRESRRVGLADDPRRARQRHGGMDSADRLFGRNGLGTETQLAWAVSVGCWERAARYRFCQRLAEWYTCRCGVEPESGISESRGDGRGVQNERRQRSTWSRCRSSGSCCRKWTELGGYQ